jgi:hypothetical protein
MHEKAHYEIFRHAGIDSYIEFRPFELKAVTIPFEGQYYTSTEEQYVARLSHNINETIGYQLPPLFLLITVTIFFGFIYIGGKLDILIKQNNNKSIYL